MIGMEFSKGELTVMQEFWEGECLDENGEIRASELYQWLNKKYGFPKTSCYTFFGRLLKKGALVRRSPKYILKASISSEDALKKQRTYAIRFLFQDSLLNVCQSFLNERKVSKDELQEMRHLIDHFETEEE